MTRFVEPFGFELLRVSASHHIFNHPDGPQRLNLHVAVRDLPGSERAMVRRARYGSRSSLTSSADAQPCNAVSERSCTPHNR